MTMQEIKTAIDDGEKVYWCNRGYQVIKDSLGQYMIKCFMNGHCIGLTNAEETKLNGEESEFFII